MNSKAVSPLIGFILMLAIIMGFIGIMQSQWVPAWNRQVEAKHLDELSYEIADLSESVSIAASTGNPAKVVVDAGVEYPNYYVLLSPSQGSGTVSSKVLSVNISGIGNYTTSAIVFKPNYLYSSSPELIYEHSAVFKLDNDALVVESGQSSFSSDRVVIYLVNATFKSFSTTDNINVVLYPISYGGVQRYSGTIAFECYNEQTAEWWNETLAKVYGSDKVSRNGNRIMVDLSDVELSINYLALTATSAGEVGHEGELNPAHLKPLLNNRTTYQLSEGEVKEFGVAVLDRYWNPIRDPDKLGSVRVSADCGTCDVYTNDGQVWCDFTAGNGECSGYVTFTLGSEFVSYTIHIKKVVTGGGGMCRAMTGT